MCCGRSPDSPEAESGAKERSAPCHHSSPGPLTPRVRPEEGRASLGKWLTFARAVANSSVLCRVLVCVSEGTEAPVVMAQESGVGW